KAIELSPADHEYYNSRGHVYAARKAFALALGDFTKAIELITKGTKLWDLLHNYYHNRGLTYFAMRNYAQAISDYSQAIDGFSSNAMAFLNRANAYEANW